MRIGCIQLISSREIPLNKYLIKQPAGIGDIIFCQKIAKTLQDRGHTIYWPVLPVIDYISSYIKLDGLGVPMGSVDRTAELIDLDSSHSKLGGGILTSKYSYAGLDWRGWQEYVTFVRNYDRERELYRILNPNDEDYIIVNNNCGTPPNTVKYNIPYPKNSNIKVIPMTIIDKYTVFDWCLLLEKAKAIYTIDTSINYITEFLNLEADNLEVYSRYNPSNFSHIEGLWTNVDWKYKEWQNI